MTNKEFYELMHKTFEACEKVAKAKGEDYTKGSKDALANFKEGGEAIALDPNKVCWVFMNKHYQAITNYVKTGGQSESEPIAERIKDMINYLVLLQGLITEGQVVLAFSSTVIKEGNDKSFPPVSKEELDKYRRSQE